MKVKSKQHPDDSSPLSFLLLVTTTLLTGLLAGGCGLFEDEAPPREYDFNFRASDHEWEGFFTGYNVGWEEQMELTADYRQLPEPLDTSHNAHYISAVNNSDDVKMLFRRQIDGLEPDTEYNVRFTIRFATNVPSGCSGIGGAPGESVMVLADASSERPEQFLDNDTGDYYRLNTQYLFNDPVTWYENATLGHIANSQNCEDGTVTEYEIKELRSGPSHTTVTTDDNGQAWLLFGTRSGFEGGTSLYYTWCSAEFSD